jgi:hypothetical protein
MYTYCVVCRDSSLVPGKGPRTVRFYLGAASSNEALAVAAEAYPAHRVLGIERFDCTSVTKSTQHAA